MEVYCFQAAESDSTASQRQCEVTLQDAKAQLGLNTKLSLEWEIKANFRPSLAQWASYSKETR